jgi:hypothetical protein
MGSCHAGDGACGVGRRDHTYKSFADYRKKGSYTFMPLPRPPLLCMGAPQMLNLLPLRKTFWILFALADDLNCGSPHPHAFDLVNQPLGFVSEQQEMTQ